MPTYNGERFLPAALHSLVDQQEPGIEYLVIDDGSGDSTMEIIKLFKTKIPLKIISTKRTGNWVQNTNLALTKAKGNYVCFFHQDDIWLPDRIKIIKKLIHQHPDVGFFLSPTLFIGSDNQELGTWRCPLPSGSSPIAKHTLLERLMVQNFIGIPSPIFRKRTALEVKGLNEKLWYTADWDFWLKLSRTTPAIYHDKPLTGFRIHPQSQTVSGSRNQDDFRDQLEQVLNKHWPEIIKAGTKEKGLRKIAEFSINVNTFLATRLHGERNTFRTIAYQGLRLGPMGIARYLSYSRLRERVTSRIRAGFLKKP